MSECYTIRPIAHIYTDFPERFGIPRQAGLTEELVGRIVMAEGFRDVNALKNIDSFSHLWLIWSFSETRIDMEPEEVHWSPLIAPPRLGGKTKVGVFASRSPYRPNSLGLSSVKLLKVEPSSPEGPILWVAGADILSGTAIFDIKPYLPYTDSHPEASQGYAVPTRQMLTVHFPEELFSQVAPDKRAALLSILQQDPRGSYEKQPGYVYGLHFADYDIRFTVEGTTLTVFDVLPYTDFAVDFHKIK